jgi:hypothetical protein
MESISSFCCGNIACRMWYRENKEGEQAGFQSKFNFISVSVSLKRNYGGHLAETLPLLAFYYVVNCINEAKLLSISRTTQHPRAIQLSAVSPPCVIKHKTSCIRRQNKYLSQHGRIMVVKKI